MLGLLFGQQKASNSWKSGVGPKLTKISGGVKHGHLEEGGPKRAKIQYGVKPDIFKILEWAHWWWHASSGRPCGAHHRCLGHDGVRNASRRPWIAPTGMEGSIREDRDHKRAVTEARRIERLARGLSGGGRLCLQTKLEHQLYTPHPKQRGFTSWWHQVLGWWQPRLFLETRSRPELKRLSAWWARKMPFSWRSCLQILRSACCQHAHAHGKSLVVRGDHARTGRPNRLPLQSGDEGEDYIILLDLCPVHVAAVSDRRLLISAF